ncbi:ribonuclease H-like domain-containing protein [Methanothermobacter sp.]|uniref:ribonuclease H-like domain-containing protein n=1 Tax=Methanothermobacter sp. TaxID=1884223 RepID=UPI003C774A6F
MFEKLKGDLMMKYEGVELEEAIGASRITAAGKEAFEVSCSRRVRFRVRESADDILSDLKLLRGVGPVTEERLKSEGYLTVPDLLAHERYSHEASRVLSMMESGDVYGLRCYLNASASDERVLGALGLLDGGVFTFLDIETLGLSDEPVILTGMAWIEDGEIHVRQRLAPEPSMEAAVLEIFRHIPSDSVLVTFNGASFDIPYIRRRSEIHKLSNRLEQCHIDLYHVSRRLWGCRLPDCRLCTVESHILGLKRDLDIPGAYVPDYYHTYLSTGNPGPLVPVVEHNREDIINMALILSHINAGSTD